MIYSCHLCDDVQEFVGLYTPVTVNNITHNYSYTNPMYTCAAKYYGF